MSHIINPATLPDSVSRLYSQARVENGTLYVSGQVGWNEENAVAGDDITSQTRRALRNIGIILDAVGKEYADVAKVTSYFVNIDEDFAAYKDVWAEFFDDPYPCHTAIGVAGLAEPELLVELEFELPLEEDVSTVD